MTSFRFWLLLVVSALALPASSAPAAVGEQPDALRTGQSMPSIQADTASSSRDLRGAERVEITTAAERILSDREIVLADVAHRSACASSVDPRIEGWCDLLQCRRTAGAQLLCYATPPPARV